MKKNIIIILTIAVAVGTVNFWPITLKKNNYKLTSNTSLAIQAQKDQNVVQTFLNGPSIYTKKHDEAIVYWKGGPSLNEEWKELDKKKNWLFGYDSFSKTPDGKKVLGNKQVPMDLYYGVQNFWKGFNLNVYYSKELKATNVPVFATKTTQRPMGIKDKIYLDNYDLPKIEMKIGKMLNEQTTWMYTLSKNLKALGYKKVHYIGLSFGSILLHEYIYQYGDKAFEFVDSITAVSMRIKSTEKEKASLTGLSFFPYKIYDKKTGKYTKTLLIDIVKNAVTTGMILPLLHVVTKKNYAKNILKLNNDNKKKYMLIATPFDFRIGSLSDYELSLQKLGIKIFQVPTAKLFNYKKNYLTIKPRNNIDQKPKTGLIGGVNNHDILLNYFVHNFVGLYGSTDFTNKKLVRKKNSFFCLIKTDIAFLCEK